MGKVTFEDEEMEEAADSSDLSYDCQELWMVTQDDTAPMADRDEAAAQLIRKAESGDPDARYLVGRLYRDGPVLIPNSVKAQYWFDQLPRQGHVPAQYALGKLYLTDDAEVHDTELGIQWLEYAAHHGSDCAAYQLGKEYLRGRVVEGDPAKATESLTQTAETGNQFAQYTLGKLYLDRRDEGQAYYWFSQAAAQGNEYAWFFLDRWDTLKPSSVMLSITRLLITWAVFFRTRYHRSPSPAEFKSIRNGWHSSEKRRLP
mgnify:FL=1